MAQPAHSAPEQPAEDEAITSRDTGRRLFPTLSLQDMVAASSTCSGWQRAAMPGWKQRALARWRVWRAPRAAASLEWQSLYKQRHLVSELGRRTWAAAAVPTCALLHAVCCVGGPARV